MNDISELAAQDLRTAPPTQMVMVAADDAPADDQGVEQAPPAVAQAVGQC